MDELRDVVMDVSRQIRWIPEFGLERELDWLRNMHDWMISKKRYWGLALPIWFCDDCGDLRSSAAAKSCKSGRSRAGTDSRGIRRTGPGSTRSRSACAQCGKAVSRIPDVGNPWLDAGIVPFSTLHYRTDPDYWQQWFPADFITESFPASSATGSTRCWR